MGIDHINKMNKTAPASLREQDPGSLSGVSEGTPVSKVDSAKRMEAAQTPLMSRSVKIVTKQSFSKLQLALLENNSTQEPNSIKSKLATLGLSQETTELPDNFAELLFASCDFTLPEKQIILEHFQPSFKTHYSREAIENKVNQYRDSDMHKKATDKQIDLAAFQEKLVAESFRHNIYCLLISIMSENASDDTLIKLISENQSAILDKLSYTNLQTTQTGADAQLKILETIMSISSDSTFRAYTSQIALKVAELYSRP